MVTPEQGREAHFALTRALRELVDGARAQERLALTDEEWAADLGDADLAQSLSTCAQVKYGVERPTHWATRERVVRARELARNHAPAAEVRA